MSNSSQLLQLELPIELNKQNINSIRNSSNSNNLKPFIKWVGGKTQLLQNLKERLPSNFAFTVKSYYEPFIGGGAFLFWLLKHFPHIKKIVINDANSALINTYRVIRDSPDKLLDLLSKMQNKYRSLSSEEERKSYFYRIRTLFNENATDNIERAALLIFLNRTCFNGLYRVNSRGHFNVPHGRYKNPQICDYDTIYADSNALNNVEILNVDFETAVQETDEHSFVYFDPPYRPLSITSSFCSYCEGGFDDSQQKRLADCCRSLHNKGVRWLLSNSDPKSLCPQDTFFDELYKGFNIQSVQASRMLNCDADKRGKLSELLISNY